MKFKAQEKTHQAIKKILPSLGGIKKNYLRKANCLKKTLQFLIRKLEGISPAIREEFGEKKKFNQILKDLSLLSLYENKNTISFYFACLSIIQNYFN